MNRHVWLVGLCCLPVLPVGAQMPIPLPQGGPGITVIVMGEAVESADAIVFEISLSSGGETYLEAWDGVQEDYEQARAALQGLNIAGDQLEVEGPMFLSPAQLPFGMMGLPGANMPVQPEEEEAEPEMPEGVQASMTIRVRLPFDPANARRSLEAAERFQSAVEEGGLQASGPSFTRRDLTSLERAAVDNALQRARRAAQATAAASGKTLGEVGAVMVLDYGGLMKAAMQSMVGGFIGEMMGAIFGQGGQANPFAVKASRLVAVTFSWE